jgi:hypothetical protein
MNLIRMLGLVLLTLLANSANAAVYPYFCQSQSAFEAGNGQYVTLTFSYVNSSPCIAPNASIPTGTVTFSGLGGPATVPLVNGIATWTFISNVTAPTTLNITAAYSGDSNYLAFNTALYTISQYVKIPPRFMNCPNNTAPAGTTEVCIDGTSPVSGSASLYLGLGTSTSYQLLGTAQVTNGIAYIPTPSGTFTPGPQYKTIYATYSGDANNVPVTYTDINEVPNVGGVSHSVPSAPLWALVILGIMLTTIVSRSRERPVQ